MPSKRKGSEVAAGLTGVTIPPELLDRLVKGPMAGVAVTSRYGQALGSGPTTLVRDPLTGDMLPNVTTTSVATARELVKRTDSAGLAALAQIAEEIRCGTLVQLDYDIWQVRTEYGMARLRDRSPAPAELAFTQLPKDVETEPGQQVPYQCPRRRARVAR